MSGKGQVGIPRSGNGQMPSPAAGKSVRQQRDPKAKRPAGGCTRGTRDVERQRAGTTTRT